MSRTNATWLAAWVGALALAIVAGTALGQLIKQFMEPDVIAVPTEAARPASISPTAVAGDRRSPVPSPVTSPSPSPVLAQVSPSPRATATAVLVLAAEPTGTPAPVATAPAPATAMPTPVAVTPAPITATPAPAVPPPSTPAPRTVLDEGFDDDRAGWPDDPGSGAWLADGAYRLVARQPGQFVAIPAPIAEPLRDVLVTGTFRKVGGPPGGGYGLIVRDQRSRQGAPPDQGGRFYVMEVGDRGEVGIWRREEDHWVDLLSWTRREAVRPGNEPNELSVRAVGARLTLQVNGANVATVEDSALDVGGVGVFVGGDLNEVVLERFVVQALP